MSSRPIRLTRPYFDESEREATLRVLESGMLVQGDEVRGFESDVLAALERDGEMQSANAHALAVANGTVALELALMLFDIGPGDEVLVPTVTWPSPGNAVLLRGATPVLVDVDPRTFNIDPARVRAALTPRTRAIIAVDQFGVPADIPAIRSVAPGVAVIEDAACSIGSSLGGVPCGLIGDVATMSFHPRKVVTTGEGGMVLTRDPSLNERIIALRNHGQQTPGVFREAGPNARMSELQAALGRAQMRKLSRILARRRSLANRIRSALDLRWQGAPHGGVVNHQTLGFVLPAPSTGALRDARDALITALRADGIEAGILSYALHRLPQFARIAANQRRTFERADEIIDGGLAVPLHPGMSDEDADAVIAALRTHAAWALGQQNHPTEEHTS